MNIIDLSKINPTNDPNIIRIIVEKIQEIRNLFEPLTIEENQRTLEEAYYEYLNQSKSKNTRNAGRKHFDPILLAKISIYQTEHSLSDVAMAKELKLNVYLRYALELKDDDKTPEKSTICRYRKAFADSNVFYKIGLTFIENKIDEVQEAVEEINNNATKDINNAVSIDSTIERHSVTRVVNGNLLKDIQQGLLSDKELHELFVSNHQKSQVDLDAAWVKKYGTWVFGYKKHIINDLVTGLILDFSVTPASVHDINELQPLINSAQFNNFNIQNVFADLGYLSQKYKDELKKKGINLITPHKAGKNKPLTEQEIKENYIRSICRSGVEHRFANHKAKAPIRYIGLNRAKYKISIDILIANTKRIKSILMNKVSIKSLSEKVLDAHKSYGSV